MCVRVCVCECVCVCWCACVCSWVRACVSDVGVVAVLVMVLVVLCVGVDVRKHGRCVPVFTSAQVGEVEVGWTSWEKVEDGILVVVCFSEKGCENWLQVARAHAHPHVHAQTHAVT